MKTKFILILAILTHSIVAQNTFTCGTISSATAQSLSRAVACTNLINDFIPKSNDRVIEVAVNFWVFTTGTSSNSAAWTNGSHITTSVDAQHCIDIANSIYTNMPAPSIAIPGVASITNAKIKLILKNFDYVLDDNSYHDIGAAAAGTGNQIWRDKRAINILLGTVSNTYVATIGTNTIVGYAPYNGNIYTGDVPGIYPKNFIVFTSQFDTNNPNWDNIYGYGGVLAHEVGHFLGLNHTTYNLNNNFHEISEIKPSFGCCSYITAQDYAEDDGTWSPCPGPPYFGAGSNNIMSQNTACGYKYLSPEQVAIIHYNLRTDLRPILYAPSYNNAIIRDASFDYLVTSNETWTSDRYFKGNITVKSGNVLVIRCGLGMTDGSFIRVEKNAKLIIDGGRITNISGRMWKGIEVEGNPNLSRNIGANPNYIYLSPNQGIVEVKNNSKISQALNAIVTATSNSIGAFQSSSSSGGVVLISNSTFENNMRDIILFDSHLSNNPENLITGSSFITTTNNIDPLLTYTFNPLEHIKMYKFKSMQKIRGCSFKNTTPYTNNNIRGLGIYSTDSQFDVDKSCSSTNCRTKFESLTKGIYIDNINPINFVNIKNSDFINNTDIGVMAENEYNLNVVSNEFYQNGTGSNVGLYLTKSKYYDVKGNNFYGSTTNGQANYLTGAGIYVNDSKIGAHQIYRNTFGGNFCGINANDENGGNGLNDLGLRMNCNYFKVKSYINNKYDISLTKTLSSMPLVMTQQSNPPPQFAPPTATNTVRNHYFAIYNSTVKNKWYVHPNSTQNIAHRYALSNLETNPNSPQTQASSQLNVSGLNVSYAYSNNCVVYTSSSGGDPTISSGSVRLNDLNTNINILRSINQNYDFDFDIQASVKSKLDIFLADTLEINDDSVTAIFTANQGGMNDADLLEIFSYIRKYDFTTASNKISNLSSARTNWKTLLNKLVNLEQQAEGVMSLINNSTDIDYFTGIANTEGADGQATAQALLRTVFGIEHEYPLIFPDDFLDEGGKLGNSDALSVKTITNDIEVNNIKIYPNPTKQGIYITNNNEIKEQLHVEIKDLLGRVIIDKFISTESVRYLELNELKIGLYFISIRTNNKFLMKNEKILIQE